MNIINRISTLLKDTYESEEARAMAVMIMEDAFGVSLVNCLTDNTHWNDAKEAQLQTILHKLLQGEPIQYVLGKALFYGRYFGVNQHVLIPRPETEDLIDIVKTLVPEQTSNVCICDAGTGSGCIAITLKAEMPWTKVEALDIEEEALKVAQNNAKELQTDVCFKKANILCEESLPQGPWNIIVSNPPYVMEKEKVDMERHVTDYEPGVALFVPNDDALVFYKALGNWALKTLKPEGRMCCEINALLAEETKQMYENMGFEKVEIVKDRYNKQRFVICQR